MADLKLPRPLSSKERDHEEVVGVRGENQLAFLRFMSTI